MKKLFLIVFFVLFSFNKVVYPAGSSGGDTSSKSNYDKAVNLINSAKNYEKKNKIEKANKKLEKALGYFLSSYKESPNNIEILSLLGFSYFLIGDPIMSEIYYMEGLDIDPKNNLLNQRLGELYFNTKRVDMAKNRLKILKSCNCEEYLNLKNIIEKN